MSNASDFIIENGVLKEYVGPGGDVVIPDGVTSIGEFAFFECSSLTSVVIPKGVTWLGNNSFGHCANLKTVTLPGSLEGVR